MKKKNRRIIKKGIRLLLFIIIILLIILFIINISKYFKTNKNISFFDSIINTTNEFINGKKDKINEYNNCLNQEYSDSDLTDNLKNKINETNEFLKNYSASVGYEEPNSKFVYKYNENKKYYAASSIKLLDALYIYDKASKGELKLTDTVTYQPKHLLGASVKMQNKKYGDKVKVKDLVNYAVIYSDNTAHLMLLDYIGKSTLREYGKSLGATYTLNTDFCGEINVNDALAYLRGLNTYFNTDTDDAKELKSWFIKSEQNYLNFPDKKIEAAEKYGEYFGYYHENGIVYKEKPYLVSILTNYSNNEKIIRTINSKILELHETFISERENRCKKIIE